VKLLTLPKSCPGLGSVIAVDTDKNTKHTNSFNFYRITLSQSAEHPESAPVRLTVCNMDFFTVLNF